MISHDKFHSQQRRLDVSLEKPTDPPLSFPFVASHSPVATAWSVHSCWWPRCRSLWWAPTSLQPAAPKVFGRQLGSSCHMHLERGPRGLGDRSVGYRRGWYDRRHEIWWEKEETNEKQFRIQDHVTSAAPSKWNDEKNPSLPKTLKTELKWWIFGSESWSCCQCARDTCQLAARPASFRIRS